jgi:hypothetical protein
MSLEAKVRGHRTVARPIVAIGACLTAGPVVEQEQILLTSAGNTRPYLNPGACAVEIADPDHRPQQLRDDVEWDVRGV